MQPKRHLVRKTRQLPETRLLLGLGLTNAIGMDEETCEFDPTDLLSRPITEMLQEIFGPFGEALYGQSFTTLNYFESHIFND